MPRAARAANRKRFCLSRLPHGHTFLEGLIPRSSVLEGIEAEDYADPKLRPLLELIETLPKKSRSSGLWGKAYDAFIARAHSLITAADQ